MYDSISVVDKDGIKVKSKWLEYKSLFKRFIVEDLKIKDERIIDRLLEEFNEGLRFNIDFRMLMLGLGLKEEAVDNIIKTYDAGEMPYPDSVNNIFVESSATIDEVKKQISKKRYYYKRKPYDYNKKEEFRRKAEEFLSRLQQFVSDVEISDESLISILNSNITVSEDALLYSSTSDLASNTNGTIPYYDQSVERTIKSVVCLHNGEYIMVSDGFALDSICQSGGKIIGVYVEIDGIVEGLYKIDDVIKRGVIR